jgi:hypothetical protein
MNRRGFLQGIVASVGVLPIRKEEPAKTPTPIDIGSKPRYYYPLPEGTYKGIVENVVITRSIRGRLMCRWKLVAEIDEHEAEVFKYSMLEGDGGKEWFRGELQILQIDPPKKIGWNKETGEAVQRALGASILFKIRRRDEIEFIDFL